MFAVSAKGGLLSSIVAVAVALFVFAVPDGAGILRNYWPLALILLLAAIYYDILTLAKKSEKPR